MMNLAHTTTIYKRRFRTISLKVHEQFREGKHAPSRAVISPVDVYYGVLTAIFRSLDDDQEHFIVLFLNTANRVIGYKVLFSGSQNSSVVDNRLIYRNALLFGAHSLIVAHNHPSGSLHPSNEDRLITRQIAEVGKLHCTELLDHLIVTHEGYTSLMEFDATLFQSR
jgi:DNA repair protein RadC